MSTNFAIGELTEEQRERVRGLLFAKFQREVVFVSVALLTPNVPFTLKVINLGVAEHLIMGVDLSIEVDPGVIALARVMKSEHTMNGPLGQLKTQLSGTIQFAFRLLAQKERP